MVRFSGYFRRLWVPLFFSSFALAQTASITGLVSDSSGAVVSGANVTAKSDATSLETRAQTNEQGYYNLLQLAPGAYTITVDMTGFKTVVEKNLALAVGQTARVNYILEVGSVAESVEVSDRAVLLDSESSTLGTVIGSKQVSELPLLGRNSYALAMLVPGVRPASGVNNLVIDQISTVAYSINGQRSNSNEFLLDGAPNAAAAQNQPVINANPDMVQEFKVETNSFSAEYGRAAGGVFNVVTRGGTNDLHFTAYEFLRNDKLNANDWFANRNGLARPPFKFNQFGGSIGGPVRIPGLYDGRNKTFFFFNTEIVRFIQGITFTAALPDPQMLTGNFAGVRQANGNPVTIYDPSTTTQTGNGFLRSPFPNNVIPGDRINPVARNIGNLFPSPTTRGANYGVINYTRTDGNIVNKNSFSPRIDHNFNDRNRMFFRYSYDDTPFNRAPVYGQDYLSIAPTAGPQTFTRWNTVLEDSHTFSPTMLMTLRYSATRLINFRRPYSDNFDIESLGLPSYMRQGMVDPISMPAIIINGLSVSSSIPNIIVGGLIGSSDYINFGNTQQNIQGNVTKNLAKHTLKFGAEYRVVQFNNLQVGDQATNFSFAPNFTQGPNPSAPAGNTGLGLATFLLGIPGGGVNPVPALAQTNKYSAVFIQDTWKLTPSVTLNLGLRYDYETPRTDRFNQLTNFDYNVASPLTAPGYNLQGGLVFPGVDGRSRYNARPDRNNFAPRAGIAWRLTPKTVVRAGAGLFYAATTGIGGGTGPFGISGYQAPTSIVTSLDGVTPIVSLSDPYPNGFNRPTGSGAGLSTLLGQSIQFTDYGNYTPYSTQWSFGVQQELPGAVLLEVGYAGSRGLGQYENRQWNQLDPVLLNQGDALRQQVANPFFGQIPVGTLANRTVPRAQLLRPFPQYDGVGAQNSSWATSSYHALEVKGEKRYSSGLNLSLAYTWSKLLDYGIGPFGGETLGASSIQNWYDLASEWSSSIVDQTHRVILNGVYELPFFRAKTGVTKALLDGWQVGGIWMAFSGGPLGISSNVNNTFSQGGGQRPNWNGVNPCVDGPTVANWLDASVFSNPPAYAFGNASRTMNGCRSDNTTQIDLSVTKNTRIKERLNIQFRTEAFNLTNTVRFSPPNQTFGNAQFGQVTSQNNLPRVIQFGLKLIY
jgi:outer membrane receptor protein involved in Fe transport